MASYSEMELPCPLFEGSEKRIEVEFAFGAKAPIDGLRSLTREQLDSLMSQVCALTTPHSFDEYFLRCIPADGVLYGSHASRR